MDIDDIDDLDAYEIDNINNVNNFLNVFTTGKLSYLKSLEDETSQLIIDTQDNIVLPNLKLVEPSESLFLSEDIFSRYLDKIIFDSFQHYETQTCLFESIFYSDYFITIDFVDFIYKIPNILLTSINNCTFNPSISFYIIPIRLNLTYKDAHSNVVIIDNAYNTIEFFEPHGNIFKGFRTLTPYNIENHVKILLSRLFPLHFELYTFKNVQNNCPIGLQTQQTIINPESGHCLAWSLLFINVRIINLFINTEDIITYFNKNFTPSDLNTYMKRYIGILEKNTLNINTKIPSHFKYHLQLSKEELDNIGDRIKLLTKQYLLELTVENNNTVINKIFEELISYHKFSNFNDIFFKTINNYLNKFKSTKLSSKRKLSNTSDKLNTKSSKI